MFAAWWVHITITRSSSAASCTSCTAEQWLVQIPGNDTCYKWFHCCEGELLSSLYCAPRSPVTFWRSDPILIYFSAGFTSSMKVRAGLGYRSIWERLEARRCSSWLRTCRTESYGQLSSAEQRFLPWIPHKLKNQCCNYSSRLSCEWKWNHDQSQNQCLSEGFPQERYSDQVVRVSSTDLFPQESLSVYQREWFLGDIPNWSIVSFSTLGVFCL